MYKPIYYSDLQNHLLQMAQVIQFIILTISALLYTKLIDTVVGVGFSWAEGC